MAERGTVRSAVGAQCLWPPEKWKSGEDDECPNQLESWRRCVCPRLGAIAPHATVRRWQCEYRRERDQLQRPFDLDTRGVGRGNGLIVARAERRSRTRVPLGIAVLRNRWRAAAGTHAGFTATTPRRLLRPRNGTWCPRDRRRGPGKREGSDGNPAAQSALPIQNRRYQAKRRSFRFYSRAWQKNPAESGPT